MAYTVDQLSTFFKNANAGTGPTAAQTLSLQALANQNAAGTLSNDQAFAATVNLASDTTTAVSVETYQFFLGYAPNQAGLAFLNNAYVTGGAQASLNGENRFIAQSISLALQNADAKAKFAASYGTMTVADTVKAAYDIIIGNSTAVAAGVNLDAAYKFFTDQTAYFTAFVKQVLPGLSATDQDLALKAAIVGEIMYQATKYNDGAGLGSYASATTTLIKDLADDGALAANNPNGGIDLFGSYGGTGTVGLTLNLTTGIDTPVASGNNDTINALLTTLTALDTIDGLAGNDTLVLADTTGGGDWTGIAGLTVKNVETVQLKSVGTGIVDTTGWTGVSALQSSTKGGATLTAANTTAISATDSALAAGATALVIEGGSTVSVTTTAATNGQIKIGGTTAPTGAVTVAAGYNGADGTAQGAITVKGGSTVSVTEIAKNAVNTTVTLGAVTVNGTANTTAVTVNQSAAATAAADVAGVVNGAVVINDVNSADLTKAGKITSVSVSSAASVAFTGNALTNLSLSGTVGAVGITTGTGVAGTSLAVALGAGTTGTFTSGYKTLNFTVSGDNTLAGFAAASAATTLNVAGTKTLTITSAAGLTSLTAATVTGSAGLIADFSGLTTALKVDTSGTTGHSEVTINATKATFVGGAGSDYLTLSGVLPTGTSIALGAGNDKVLGAAAAAPAASATTVIDGGDGFDTVATSLINVGNVAVFKNFEALNLSSAAGVTFDVSLVSGITGLNLSTAQVASTAYNNVTTAQSLVVDGNAGAASATVLGFTGTAGTADAYTISFAGIGGATSGAAVTFDAGTVTTNTIEKLTVNSGSASGFAKNAIILDDTAAQTVTVTGSQALTLKFAANFGNTGAGTVGVSSIDASAATGAITVDTTNITKATGGLSVTTGTGADKVTIADVTTVVTGAGNDTITLKAAAVGSTITTGTGADTVDVSLAVGTTGTTVSDFATGDTLKFAAIAGTYTKADITAATSLTQALNIAANTATNGTVSWFQYGGNTYVVQDNDNAANTLGATDILVKLTGIVDLSKATVGGTTLVL